MNTPAPPVTRMNPTECDLTNEQLVEALKEAAHRVAGIMRNESPSLFSIPANPRRDIDLLLLECADRLSHKAETEGGVDEDELAGWLWDHCSRQHRPRTPWDCKLEESKIVWRERAYALITKFPALSPARAAMPGGSLTDAVAAFLMKYDKIEPAMIDAFKHQFIHGMKYEGENWGKELDAMRLAASETLQGDTAHHAEASTSSGIGVGLRSLPPVEPRRPALTEDDQAALGEFECAYGHNTTAQKVLAIVGRLVGKET